MGNEQAPAPRHPGRLWLSIFGAGGNLAIPDFDFSAGVTDQYYGVEPGISTASNPATYAQGLNGELDREAGRHGRDWTADEVREALGSGADAFNRSLEIVGQWGFDSAAIIYGTHRLQSLREEEGDGQPHEGDPWGLILAFPELPANDKNDRGKHSARVAARYLEGLTGFLEAPQAALATMEQQSAQQGHCIKLRMPSHNGDTRLKTAQNCKREGVTAPIFGSVDLALRDKFAA